MISIITSTYNKAQYLELTLAAFTIQTYKEFELVIVDDGSSDNTEEIVHEYDKILKIVYVKQENCGIAAARNKALQLASGKYIIVIDDDRIPNPEFVLTHKKNLDKGDKIVCIGKQCLVMPFYANGLSFEFKDEMKIYNLYPELLSLESKQIITEKEIVTDFYNAINKCYLSVTGNSKLLESYGEDLKGMFMAWSRAYGGNIAFDRSLCMRQPEYDTNYKGYGFEDVDFSYQFYLQEYKFCFCKDAVNYHQEHLRKKNEVKEQYKNFAYFCKKFPHLEVALMKMDWDGRMSFEETNIFGNIIEQYYLELKELMEDYHERKVKINDIFKGDEERIG